MSHTPLSTTIALLEDAINREANPPLLSFKIDGNQATLTNREGHSFTVNMEAGIERVIAHCFDNNVRIFKDYQLEQTLLNTEHINLREEETPATREAEEKPKPRGRRPGKASE